MSKPLMRVAGMLDSVYNPVHRFLRQQR
jgi:hypothetical protein